MARGYKSKFGDRKIFYVRIRGLNEDRIYLSQTTREGDEYVQLENIFRVSGELVEVGVREVTPKKENVPPYKLIQLTLVDEDEKEVVILESTITSIARNIINSLAGADNLLGELAVSVYNTKEGGHPAVCLWLNKERLDWKYSWEELQKRVKTYKITEGGKEVEKKDFFELNEWLVNEVFLKEIAEKVQPKDLSTTTAPVETAPSHPQQELYAQDDEGEEEDGNNEEDDLPF